MLDTSCTWANARVLDLSWRMCVYSASADRFVSASILSGGAWEGRLVADMIRTMRAHPGAVQLDIGSNVGFYTLAAVTAGFKVHASTYLDGARRIIGVNMEFGQSRRRCCSQWVETGGAFDVFHRKHSLCPKGTSYANVCKYNAWDLVWSPCART